MQRGRLPPILVVGFGGAIVLQLVSLFGQLVGIRQSLDLPLWFAGSSSVLAAWLGAAIGSAELVKRSSGRAAFGMRIAMYGSLGVVATWLANSAMIAFDLLSLQSDFTLMQWAFWGVATIAGVGFVIAAGPRRTVVIVLAVLWLVGQPPPFAHAAMRDWFGQYWQLPWLIESIMHSWVALALVAIVPRSEETADASVAAVGFRRAANALWLRAMAAIAGVFVVVLSTSAHTDGATIAKLGLLTGGVVSLIAFIVFGVGIAGVARAALPDLPRYSLAIAAGIALWCCSVALVQLPWSYRAVEHHEDFGIELATVLSTTMAIVTTIGGAFAIGAITSFARRRGLHDLQQHASAAGIAWMALMIAGLVLAAVANLSPTGATLCGLAGSVCGVMAQVVFAKLLGVAAVSVDQQVTLPPAIARQR
jgi:hypothetical protein